jgi:hypothetical protein
VSSYDPDPPQEREGLGTRLRKSQDGQRGIPSFCTKTSAQHPQPDLGGNVETSLRQGSRDVVTRSIGSSCLFDEHDDVVGLEFPVSALEIPQARLVGHRA